MEPREAIDRQELLALLHRLWSKAVGTSDYAKSEWMKLEGNVLWLLKLNEKRLREDGLP